jgi:hypothetical protein
MESSMTLTYEGRNPQHTIIFCRDYPETAKQLGSNLVEFKNSLSIPDALLGEKWVRAVVDGRRVALIATKHKSGAVRGLVSFSTLPKKDPPCLYAPHEGLIYLQALLTTGDMALVASPHGDLFVILANGIVFQRTQGSWHYLNYSIAHRCLTEYLSEHLATAVLRSALDLSYERSGALICVLDHRNKLPAVVPDHAVDIRPNKTLRESLVGLDLLHWEQRQVITAAATTDGATIVSRAGDLLDIACMIAQPPPERLQRITGTSAPRTFPGARSTAAWNASIYGLALKVSEDGPITIFHHGREIHRIGGGSWFSRWNEPFPVTGSG